MNIFFAVITIFIFSFGAVHLLQNMVGKSTRITSLLAEYRLEVIVGMTIIIIFTPFVIAWVLGREIPFANIASSFLVSLVISILVGFSLMYLRTVLVRNKTSLYKQHDEFLRDQVLLKSNEHWETTIEFDTLERFGLDSSGHISFASIDRLGNQLGEMAMLEREIDSLETQFA